MKGYCWVLEQDSEPLVILVSRWSCIVSSDISVWMVECNVFVWMGSCKVSWIKGMNEPFTISRVLYQKANKEQTYNSIFHYILLVKGLSWFKAHSPRQGADHTSGRHMREGRQYSSSNSGDSPAMGWVSKIYTFGGWKHADNYIIIIILSLWGLVLWQ